MFLVFTLQQILVNFIYYLPLIFLILGFIGFIGNLFTYLQAELRTNTCCIYTLCGSVVDIIHLLINALPDYLAAKHGIQIPWERSSDSCRMLFFLFVCLPNLSLNFLIMSMIDRYACTCDLTWKIHRLNRLKALPWTISLTTLSSCLASIYAPIMAYRTWIGTCSFTDYKLYGVLNTIINGLLPPVLMLIFVLLTYRNIHRSRRRVSAVTSINPPRFRNQFIALTISQVFVTAVISLQWMSFLMYHMITAARERTIEQQYIRIFVFTVTGYCYYLNNVKSFYISLLTSRLFRDKFIQAIKRMFNRARWR